MTPRLPIDEALPGLIAALRGAGRAVLQAPPGAGKTTRVPLAMLAAGLTDGRIVMLEPRRLAARAAAERMAETLGEPVGATVGYRMRGKARVSGGTRIEVVTEGILTRMLQADPELTGIGALIFDEFHERSLAADLGLALALDVRGALRPDLLMLVMSATLDAGPVAALLDEAPVVTAAGHVFPVETVWLDRPVPAAVRFEAAAAELAARAAAETAGGVLVFLPGEGEIRRVAALLAGRLPADMTLHALYGALEIGAQRAAIAPAATGRKLVLATAIAETSLTIEGVRAVVDGGLARRARFDPGSGMSRLVTEKVTRAEADQRRGRAGRLAEGRCYRLWTRGEDGALAAFAPPEIASSDLAGLTLELALWGSDGGDLRFLTPPPAPALAEARALLAGLGALDAAGRATRHGQALAALPLHPRIGHMLRIAGAAAAPLAALLEARDPLRGAGADLRLRLEAVTAGRGGNRGGAGSADPAALERIRAEARRLAPMAGAGTRACDPAEMAALAYPDRIALRRGGDAPRFVLSGGKGAVMDAADPLAQARMLVATDLDGDPREARIRQAIAIDEAAVRALFADRVAWHDECTWSPRAGRVVARQVERLGALDLRERPWPAAPPEALALAALDGLRATGLPMGERARRLQARAAFLAREGTDLPDLSDAALLAAGERLLLPWLAGRRTAAELAALDLTEALEAALGWEARQTLDRLAPASFETPLGRRVPIDYGGEHPSVALRLQEVFGVTRHPTVGARGLPLRMTLLSPAQRPVQVTMDLPGFWATSYADVRKDMRGRYPRHPWPEDPTVAEPTLRARPRGG